MAMDGSPWLHMPRLTSLGFRVAVKVTVTVRAAKAHPDAPCAAPIMWLR